MLKELFTGVPSLPSSRGDVKLSVLCGVPTISQKRGSKSIQVSMQPEGAKFAINGYCFEDAPFVEIIKKAADEGLRVLVRIEKQRKKDVDPSIPIAELSKDVATAQKNIISACTGVYDFTNSKWILSGSLTDPENDPPEITKAIRVAQEGEPDVSADDFFKQPHVRVPNPANFDTSQQLLTMYYFIKALENKYGYSIKEEDRRAFSKKLLRLSDEIQKLVKNADIVDHRDYSHTRARYILFNYEDHFENLTQEQLASINQWIKSCYNHAKEVIEWSYE